MDYLSHGFLRGGVILEGEGGGGFNVSGMCFIPGIGFPEDIISTSSSNVSDFSDESNSVDSVVVKLRCPSMCCSYQGRLGSRSIPLTSCI
jgi:hypothetical protein